MRCALAVVLAVLAPGLLGCDIGKITVGTTAKILVRAQPSLQQESDYQLAHDAIPGADIPPPRIPANADVAVPRAALPRPGRVRAGWDGHPYRAYCNARTGVTVSA